MAVDPAKVYRGAPCKRGHDGLRWRSTNNCVECNRDYAREYNAQLTGVAYNRHLLRSRRYKAVVRMKRREERRGAV